MKRFRNSARTSTALVPRTTAGAGEVLWGEAPRRQPIVPLIALALITLLVAAPAAMSGQGQSSNPVVLLHNTAGSLYSVTAEMVRANDLLELTDKDVFQLRVLSANMVAIQSSAAGMAEKTAKLNASLTTVGSSVQSSGAQLSTVNQNLSTTAKSMGTVQSSVNGSLAATNQIVAQFASIDSSITAMSKGLTNVITLMSASVPQTTKFATNTTRLSIAGGDGHKFGVPNLVPGNKVMSVVLPMISNMQNGGSMGVRKDSATASNPLVGFLLNRQLPDGVNTSLGVQPYDGFYGLPSQDWFVNHQVNGF